jgi:hypothetical protein
MRPLAAVALAAALSGVHPAAASADPVLGEWKGRVRILNSDFLPQIMRLTIVSLRVGAPAGGVTYNGRCEGTIRLVRRTKAGSLLFSHRDISGEQGCSTRDEILVRPKRVRIWVRVTTNEQPPRVAVGRLSRVGCPASSTARTACR